MFEFFELELDCSLAACASCARAAVIFARFSLTYWSSAANAVISATIYGSGRGQQKLNGQSVRCQKKVTTQRSENRGGVSALLRNPACLFSRFYFKGNKITKTEQTPLSWEEPWSWLQQDYTYRTSRPYQCLNSLDQTQNVHVLFVLPLPSPSSAFSTIYPASFSDEPQFHPNNL